MSRAETRAIRAYRRAQGVTNEIDNQEMADSSIDGVDLPPDHESDIGEDSDSSQHIRNAQNDFPPGEQTKEPAEDDV
ncbi:hypothetical protein DFH28DRAFT_867893, partial [Melampsora americana]